MKRSYALKKGRYITLKLFHQSIVMKVKNSKVVQKIIPEISGGAFNKPVECIEIDPKEILVIEKNKRNPNWYEMMSLNDLKKRSKLLNTKLISDEGKHYVNLSEIEFSEEFDKDLFKKTRGQ